MESVARYLGDETFLGIFLASYVTIVKSYCEKLK